jgi:hypothetical protein
MVVLAEQAVRLVAVVAVEAQALLSAELVVLVVLAPKVKSGSSAGKLLWWDKY